MTTMTTPTGTLPTAAGTLPAATGSSRLFAVDDATARRLVGAESACFIHRPDIAASRFQALRAALPDRVHLAYAVKSNPGAPLLRALAGCGAWFDCASAGEVDAVAQARRAVGAQMDDTVVFAGPGKRTLDLQVALTYGLRVQVDGIEDLHRLDALLQARDRTGSADPLSVSVRVHPLAEIAEANPIIGGAGPSVFGVDQEDLAQFLDAARAFPRIRIDGLQVFAAGNELDTDTLLANHRVALEIGQELQSRLGHDLVLIDLGGGLGIPYAADEGEIDPTRLGAGLGSLLEQHTWFTGQLLLEPGRWLSGPSSVYATTVTRVKHSRGTSFAILAGGINHLLRPLLTGQSFPVRRADPAVDEESGRQSSEGQQTASTLPFTLTGPLCTSLDRVGVAELPADLSPGDVLVFGQAGAYSVTQAMTHFLSHPAPDEHWITASH